MWAEFELTLSLVWVQAITASTNPTPNAKFNPETLKYYKDEVLPNVYAFGVLALAALVLLVYLIVWCAPPAM